MQLMANLLREIEKFIERNDYFGKNERTVGTEVENEVCINYNFGCRTK